MEAISAAAIEVEDLDDFALLEAASEAERAGPDGPVAQAPDRVPVVRAHPATAGTGTATWGDAGLPGLADCDASLAGDGTPSVAPFVAEELGAAMGVSTQSAMSLMAHALDLRHRFPLLHAKVENLEVAPWKTRQVAEATRSLPFDAARWMDQELAARVDGFGIPTIERLVALAAARFAPEEQAEKEQSAVAVARHPHPPASGEFAGTSRLEAAGDTADLTAFHQLVSDVAQQLGRLGDTDDFETRKAKALGIIAGRQPTLHPATRPRTHATVPRRPVQTHLYVHVSLADLATHLGGDPAVGEVEKLGPATLDLIRSWLGDSKATVQPVLDLNRCDAVDQHDPPPRMREQVILRDRHCVFPWCGRDARRSDLDHTIPDVPPDEGGPPGPDQPPEPRALVSAHHRAKTFTGWTYEHAATAPTNGPAPTDTPGASDPTAPRPYERALDRADAGRAAAYTLAT